MRARVVLMQKRPKANRKVALRKQDVSYWLWMFLHYLVNKFEAKRASAGTAVHRSGAILHVRGT